MKSKMSWANAPRLDEYVETWEHLHREIHVKTVGCTQKDSCQLVKAIRRFLIWENTRTPIALFFLNFLAKFSQRVFHLI